jgi:predicted transcriptional regulator
MSGEKRVEFRRGPYRGDVKAVLVYATSPVQRLIGYFEIAFVEESSPTALWRKYRRVGGIEYGDYRRYYAGTQRAVAIGVGKVHRLAKEPPLSRLGPGTVPPQSFRYVPMTVLEELRSPEAEVPPSLARRHPNVERPVRGWT